MTDSSRVSELMNVNKLWKTSYTKLEEEYDKLMEANAELHKKLQHSQRDRQIYFDLANKYTAMLNGVKESIKSYGRNEHLYGKETLQDWIDNYDTPNQA